MQDIFVYYSGNGGSRYLTSPSPEEARSFVLSEGISKYGSLFKCDVKTTARGTYWLRNGIPVLIHNNLIAKDVEGLL